MTDSDDVDVVYTDSLYRRQELFFTVIMIVIVSTIFVAGFITGWLMK